MALGDVKFFGKSGLWNDIVLTRPISSYVGSSLEDLVRFVETEHSKNYIIVGVIPYDIAQIWNSDIDISLSDKKIHAFAYCESRENNRKSLHQPIITNLHFPSQKVFNNQFSEVTHLIKEGQIYQINLTDKVTAESELTAEDWFSYIAYEFPKAHSCLFDLGGQQIISASPEMFLKIYPDSMITTEPIKGTAKSIDSDTELLTSRKEAAELAMITDLLRNDLSNICEVGTVMVDNDRKLQHLEKITHTSSALSGKLRENISPIRALVSCFPGGSITGCPKTEAIKSIAQLERNSRGFYTGCAFQLFADGSLNSSILIRTLEKTGNQLKLGVGSGIVWDSNSEDEYKEMLNKAYLLADLQ